MSQEERIQQLQRERWEYEKGMAYALGQLAEAARILEWYAKEVHWIQGRYEGGVFFTVAEDDKGKRARDFLTKHEGNIY